MRDSKRNIQVVHAGNLTLNGTNTIDSDWVDMRGFDKCTFFIINNLVTDAGAAAGFTSQLRHSADTTDAGAADCVAADTPDGVIAVATTGDGDDDMISGGMGYIGSRRYVGIDVTGTAASAGDITVIAVLSGAHVKPTTFVGTEVART